VSARVGVALTPRRHDPVGVTRGLSRNYAAAFARLGFETAVVELSSDDPGPAMRLAQPDIKLILSHSGWLLHPTIPYGEQVHERLRAANKTVMVLIADPPFSPWVSQALDNLPPRGVPFVIDPGFAAHIRHRIPSRLAPPILPAMHRLDGHGPAPTAEKDIPLLFVGTIGAPDKVRTVAGAEPGVLPLFQAVVDAALSEPAKALMAVAGEVLPSLGRAPDMDNALVRRVLFLADMFLRHRRRRQIVEQLGRHRALIVVGGIGRLQAGGHATYLPPQPFADTLALLRRARATIVCQPNFGGALNERIVCAMQARALVIATPNARVRQLFEHGRHLFLTASDFTDLDDWIAAAADERRAEPMREAAYGEVSTRFTPEGNIRYMLQVLAENGLLDPDLAVPAGPRLAVPPLD
jgi:hypothetical protein